MTETVQATMTALFFIAQNVIFESVDKCKKFFFNYVCLRIEIINRAQARWYSRF